MSVCPSCGSELDREFRFCPHCGADVGTPTPAARHEERKVVSILFCDLVGFTSDSEQADPEDVRARLDPYHRQLRQVIDSHGGTVEKFAGDAVMAVFGAPVAHEDDAERAVRAGLRIIEALEELNQADPSLRLQVRVGINTGEAVVAVDAHPERGEAFVTGDVVNTASRLQQAAPVNSIAVSEPTFRRTQRLFTYARLDPVHVKGKTAALEMWQPRAARARFGADVVRSHATPLVGRELERPLLIATFERALKQRACQLVTLVGEPGVGKTRLCAELLHYLEERPGLIRWRQGRCPPYGEGIAFWPLGEIVKAHCGILDSDPPEDASRKLDEAISADEADRGWLVRRLAPLIGTRGEPAPQEESFAAWRRFLEGLAAENPTVLVFEDLHWADPAMLEFLEHLADWAEGVPLLLLCTARPELQERHPNWAAGLRNAQTITLAPLSDEETARLFTLLLERTVLPAATQRALIDRAGGNPLYAEELVRLLSDRNLLPGPLEDIPFPDSVQALIAARLDTLSMDRKSLLQDAAVVGKVFWAGALAAMGSRDPREVELALHELARKELVRPLRSSSMAGEREYGFWHLLVRDVCYAQIPRPGRIARHRTAARWIEQQAGERVDDVADVLAHHYLSALELARAAGQTQDVADLEGAARHQLALAGTRALAIDVTSAEVSFARALEFTPAGHPERAALLERWAHAAEQLGRLVEARSALEEALALYRGEGSNVAAGRVLTALAGVLRVVGDPLRSEVIVEAVEVLEREDPGPELVSAYGELASDRVVVSSFEEASAAAERAIDLAARLHLPEPGRALGVRGFCRAYLGETNGLLDMRRAVDLAVEQGKGRDAATLQNNFALASWQYGGPPAALGLCDDAIAFCERRGMAEWQLAIEAMRLNFLAGCGRSDEVLRELPHIVARGKTFTGAILTETRGVQFALLSRRGERVSVVDAEELVRDARAIGEAEILVQTHTAATLVMVGAGKSDRAAELLDDIADMRGMRGGPYYAACLTQMVRSALAMGQPDVADKLMHDVEAHTPMQVQALATCQALTAEAGGDHAAAAGAYADVISGWRRLGDVPELAYALLGQGRCMVVAGTDPADEPLREARELFHAMGYAPALAETEALLQRAAATTSSP